VAARPHPAAVGSISAQPGPQRALRADPALG
jgi:hypothetical protein